VREFQFNIPSGVADDWDDLKPDGDGNDSGLTTEEDSSEYEEDDDDDPVVAEYDCFLNGNASGERFELIFAGLNKDTAKEHTGAHCPTEFRIKPESGFIEVDLPIDIHHEYDRQKGVKFGEALRKSKDLGQESYGPSAGFELKMPRPTKRPGASAAAEGQSTEEADAENEEAAKAKDLAEQEKQEGYVQNFEDANEKGHVMNTQTWSGQLVSREAHKPNYYVVTFRDKEAHFTPLTGQVLLQPDNKHLDALHHLEVASRHKEADAKEVMPTVAKAESEMTPVDHLKQAAKEEFWRLRWNDRKSEAALAVKERQLFVHDTSKAKSIEWENTEAYVDRLLPTGAGMSRKSRSQNKKPIQYVEKGGEFER
jgi:DNA-directed RNA polymerase-3 subunit RPC5